MILLYSARNNAFILYFITLIMIICSLLNYLPKPKRIKKKYIHIILILPLTSNYKVQEEYFLSA